MNDRKGSVKTELLKFIYFHDFKRSTVVLTYEFLVYRAVFKPSPLKT